MGSGLQKATMAGLKDIISPEQRKSWARLIQKTYETDPLICPKCAGSMKIIAFIEREDLIQKILKLMDPNQEADIFNY